MRFGKGGTDWITGGKPAILLNGEKLNPVDLVYADDSAGEVLFMDWSKEVCPGCRFFSGDVIRANGGNLPTILKTGSVEFVFGGMN